VKAIVEALQRSDRETGRSETREKRSCIQGEWIDAGGMAYARFFTGHVTQSFKNSSVRSYKRRFYSRTIDSKLTNISV
jgi:hypothetical protein